MTIKENLENAIIKLKESKIEDANLKARLLLAHILGKSKEYLIVNDNKLLEKEEEIEYENSINKIIKNVPIQYITNKQEFFGIEFFVNENVLIPQPDTEILVEEVINISKKFNKTRILDLCTGSGAIAITLSLKLENANIVGTDISDKALEVAKINDKEKKVQFIKSDMFNSIHNEKFDIIVSNPPYIKTDVIKTLSKDVQQEPNIALNGGNDGLQFYKIIAENAYKYMNDNAYLCLEIGDDQKEEVTNILQKANYKNIHSKKDLADHDRIIICNI